MFRSLQDFALGAVENPEAKTSRMRNQVVEAADMEAAWFEWMVHRSYQSAHELKEDTATPKEL